MVAKLKKIIYNLLRWTEKWTRTDMIYLTKGGFWLTLGQVISSSSSLLLAIAFANLIPKETYGHYKYIISIFSLLTITSLDGIDTVVTLATAKGFDKIFTRGLKIKLRWSLFGSLGAMIFAGYYLAGGNIPFFISFLIVAAVLPLGETSLLYTNYLMGKKKFDLKVKYTSLTQLIGSLGLILVLLINKNLVFIVLVYFLIFTVLKTCFFLRTITKVPPNQNDSEQFIPYGKQLSFLRILVNISNQIDKILVYNLLGTAQLAIYSFAISPVEQGQSILKNIRVMAAPKFSASNEKAVKRSLINKIARATFLIAIPIFLYIIFAPYLYQIFFPQYLASITYSRLYALTILFFPLTLIPSYFQAKIKKKEIYSLTVIPPLVKIASMIILTPWYGIAGVIWAIIISDLASALLGLVFFKIYRTQ